MSSPLGFSVETSLDMNSKSSTVRRASTGTTRAPCRPTTIRSPLFTKAIFTVRADRPDGETTMPESISGSLTVIHRPFT